MNDCISASPGQMVCINLVVFPPPCLKRALYLHGALLFFCFNTFAK